MIRAALQRLRDMVALVIPERLHTGVHLCDGCGARLILRSLDDIAPLDHQLECIRLAADEAFAEWVKRTAAAPETPKAAPPST